MLFAGVVEAGGHFYSLQSNVTLQKGLPLHRSRFKINGFTGVSWFYDSK